MALSKINKKSQNLSTTKKVTFNDLFLMLEFKDKESNQFINECVRKN